jgi:LysM repeat protein
MPESAMSRPLVFASLAAISVSLAAGPPAPAAGGCGGVHVVARGDTLYSLARRCGSTVVGIAQASGLADPRRIEVGQRLVIPGEGEAPAPPEPGKDEPSESAGLDYAFQPGDTLFSLARWAHVGVRALIAANPGINPHKVEIGDTVRLPAGAIPPGPARYRELGNGPGPALVRPEPVMIRTAPMPPRAVPDRLRERGPAPDRPIVRRYDPLPPPPLPPPPRRYPKPDGDDEREPEGM